MGTAIARRKFRLARYRARHRRSRGEVRVCPTVKWVEDRSTGKFEFKGTKIAVPTSNLTNFDTVFFSLARAFLIRLSLERQWAVH